MYFANLNNKRISIKEAIKENIYTCPICGGILIPKQGKIMVWHFAHKSKVNCIDYYDNKGEWHREMQELFPEQNREVYSNYCNKHIFDILTNNFTIIEFQHSPIKREDFDRRTKDYINNQNHYFYLGKSKRNKPVWVFDFSHKEIKVKKAKNTTTKWRNFHWSRAAKIFDKYNCFEQQEEYELWFMINPYGYSSYEYTNVNGFEQLVRSDTAKQLGIAFVNVKIKNKNYFGGNCFTKNAFINYITSI